ncbi:MAG: FIST N-terminal domain-containing protein [Candidatus Aenigmatarchaeota archaeon]
MSREKIIEALEKRPSGLSISELAEATGLHRNTVSKIIEELEKSGEVKMKEVGKAKIYFLKTYEAIHTTLYGYRGANISIGIGISDLSDGFNAAVSAAKQAAMQSSKGAMPTFSIVFVSSKYNSQIDKVVQGINKILGTSWIGCTTDREINSILGYSEGTIQVLCIDTPHLYFGVGVSENYRKDPFEEGKRAVIQAINNCPVDRSKFGTMEFIRGSKKEFGEIIKHPPYFILTFISGLYFDNGVPYPGLEYEFLEGIKDHLGPFIPIVGASAVSNVDDYLKNIGENYIFANGRYYKNTAAVVCFVVSELYFSFNSSHGYIPKNTPGIITKVSGNGRIIEEINGRYAVEEYSKLIGIPIDEVISKNMIITTQFPISVVSYDGNLYPIACGINPDKKTMFTFSKVFENSVIDIGIYNEEKTIKTMRECIEGAVKGFEDKKPILLLVFSCAGRRYMLRDKVHQTIEEVKNHFGDAPLFGFYSNGEIGSRRDSTSRYNNFTVTCLVIFDKLQI